MEYRLRLVVVMLVFSLVDWVERRLVGGLQIWRISSIRIVRSSSRTQRGKWTSV